MTWGQPSGSATAGQPRLMQQSSMLWKRCKAGAQISPRRGSTRLHSSERRNALLPGSRASRRSSSYLRVKRNGSLYGLPV